MDNQQAQIAALVARSRAAGRQIKNYNQQQLFQLAQAVAWAVMQPDRNRQLSQQAVKDTGLGHVADKITKNHRKTLGLLRDVANAKTTGIIKELPEQGITEIARPIGVIATLIPSTNPIATPVNNIINAVACGNSIIVSPSPRGVSVFQRLLSFIHAELSKINAPLDLVLAMPEPPSKVAANMLMQLTDLVIVTGSQNNVRQAYSSGTPAIGVGTGNVTTIVDETADVQQVAQKVALSKTFDNATSCSSENNLICVNEQYSALLHALQQQGGVLLQAQQQQQLLNGLWREGKLNTAIIAKDANSLASYCNIEVPATTRFLIASANAQDIQTRSPLTKERMAPVLSLFEAKDYAQAVDFAEQLLTIQGAGHSLGLHSEDDERARQLAMNLPTCRVIVNQAHCFATGGAFNNGMPFSLSMGCGSWGGNSIADNLHYRHFLNTTRIVRPIPKQEPSVEDLLGDYINEFG